MNRYKKLIVSTFLVIFVFLSTLFISFTVYSYGNRFEPILYRSQDGANSDFASIFIQNPFRDKTKEIIAKKFLRSIQDKTVTESLNENREVDFNNPKGFPESGKLVEWELLNRFDNDDETQFSYSFYREDNLNSPKKPLLSFVVLKLRKVGSEWKVKNYTCHGTSNNS